MPNVILGERARREAALREYINRRKVSGGRVWNDCEMAALMCVGRDTFSHWKRRKFPAFFESLCCLFRKTRITDRELCRIFGVKYNGGTKNDGYDSQTAETRPAG